MQVLCKKYNDLATVDKLAAVAKKVENVKVVMQDNVDIALQNCVKLENIEKQAEELQQQAGVFKKNANELKNKMRCKEICLNCVLPSSCYPCLPPSLASLCGRSMLISPKIRLVKRLPLEGSSRTRLMFSQSLLRT